MWLLLHSLKARWPLVIVVVTTPLLLGITYAWITDNRPRLATIKSAPVSSAKLKPARSSQSAAIDYAAPMDRRQQIQQLREQLNILRSVPESNPVNVGRVLLQLGKMETAEGNHEAAAVALRAIASLHADAGHWQMREAGTRLAALDELAHCTADDRRLWSEVWDLSGEAQSQSTRGHFREAIDRAEQALDASRRLGGPEHPETVECLLLLAGLSTEHDESYLQAEGHARDAVERIRSVWGTQHPAYGEGLQVLATLADDRGDFAVADRLYDEALAVYRGSLGELSREFARALNRQGRMHNVWWKDYGSGKTFRALQIREQILDRQHPDCAESLEDLGEVALSLLNFSHAETLLEQALSIRRRRQGTDHPDLARPQCLLAACQVEQGNVAQALVNVRRALTHSEHCRGSRHPLVAEQRIILATIQKRGLADYSAAYLMSQRTLDGLQALGQQQHPRYCRAMFEQAECLRTDAVYHLDEENVHPSLAAAKLRTEEAIDAYRSLPEGEKIGFYCEAICILCEVLYLQNYAGDTREIARKLIEESERLVAQNGGPIHPAFSLVSLGQGRYCSSRGLYDQAIPFQHEFARRVQQQVGLSHPWLYTDSLSALAGVYLHQGTDLESSRRYSSQAFDVFQELFRRNAAGQSDSSRLPLLIDCFQMLSTQLSTAEAQNDLPSTYDMVLSLRGVATSYQAAHRIAHDHPELQPLLNEVRQTRLAQKLVALSTDATESAASWVGRLQAVSEVSDLADSELAIATRPFVPNENEVTWQQLQARLPPRTALIDFMQYVNLASPPGHQGRLVRHRRILAFLLTNSGPPQCVPLGESRPIERAINGWRQAIDDFQRGESTDIEQPTRELAQLVWSPIVNRLGDVDNLSIAPDGPLCFVSFAALPGRKVGTYALEDYEINYVNSGRWLYDQWQDSQRPNGEGVLLCGAVDYQGSHQSEVATSPTKKNREPLMPDPRGWNNLLATGLEVEQVAGLFQDAHPGNALVTTLTGSDATADVLEAALVKNSRYVHFAGHGFFVDPEKARALAGRIVETLGESTYFTQKNQLLLSGLVLAPGADSPAGPSILTAKDVGSLDLRGTDLVVLSACETGLGCTAGSDGVLGLTRAFLTAGSRSVISSLWKVEDAATSLLMEEFYRNLWERGQSKREALRNAQIAVLRAPGQISDRSQDLALRGIKTGNTKVLPRDASTPGRSHPALWAAFVLNGDWK